MDNETQSQIAALNPEVHGKVKLTLNKDFSHLEKHNVSPLIVHEIATAAADLPVVFIKNSNNDEYVCVALLGLKEEENLLVKAGKWDGMFIPAGYTHYPLSLVPMPEDPKRYTITIDMASETISETEGEALFNEDGTESEHMQSRRKALENYYQAAMTTRSFVKELADLELLEEQGFSFDVNGQKRNVTGVHIVNEQKFNELSDEAFLDLKKKGFLGPIFAHLLSLRQTQRLVARIPQES